MPAAKATPKILTITVNYNASIKANLEKISKKDHAYESMQVSDSESRTYNVEGMSEEEVQEFSNALRESLKETVDERVMNGYAEIFE